MRADVFEKHSRRIAVFSVMPLSFTIAVIRVGRHLDRNLTQDFLD
jgi:hypothetical protein